MRILGLDVGSTSVKAVELDSAFGRFEVHEYHEAKIAPGQSPLEVTRDLLAGLPKAPDRIAVAVRTSRITFRTLQLPTRDKKAIQAGVGFELDDDLPFALEDAIYDYSVLQQAGQLTTVHVAATLEDHLRTSLAEWAAAGIDPDLVTTEAWAYRALLNRILTPEQTATGPSMLLNIGHDHTVIYIHWKGQPVVAREVPIGGRDLTRALAAHYRVPEDQAEVAKLDHGFVLPASQREQASPEQIEFSQTLLEPLGELIREVRHAALICKNLVHVPAARLHLAGGSSLLPGLARLLEEEVKLPVTPIQALSTLANSGVTYSESTDATFVLAASLALCQVGSERTLAINLRKGAFTKVSSRQRIDLDRLKKPLTAIGIVSASLLLSLVIESQVYRSRVQQVDEQLQKSIRSFLSTASPSAIRTYLANPSILKKQIRQELEKARDVARLAGPNPKSPLALLREVSATVPKDVTVDLLQYQAGASPSQPYQAGLDGEASFTFLIQGQATADRLATLLDRKIPGVSKSKVEETTLPDGTKRFKVTLKGKPAEDAYGK